jgi:hypothetical protein
MNCPYPKFQARIQQRYICGLKSIESKGNLGEFKGKRR